uniref:Uncharacterized protein n=1 Tax=Molossus molossus TaxID=27622 RepID=A0A7J8GQV5_MOLMO|nr:hypothetical protein HJG59_011324 [Molossus molossus]
MSIYVYQGYIFLLDRSFQYCVVAFFVSSYGLHFETYLIRYEYCYPSFFCFVLFCFFPFAWKIFFHPFTFNLCESFVVRWVSCKQHIDESCFLIQSATLCLFMKAFNPFTFKVIIDMYLFIANFF